MKELNLCELLKDCGNAVFYSPIWGDTKMTSIFPNEKYFTIRPVSNPNVMPVVIQSNGRANAEGEMMLFPAKDQRDWAKWAEENKKVTYKDVCKELFTCNYNVNGDVHTTSTKQFGKLIAINKLMNVQKYIEKGWQPDWRNRNEDKWSVVIKQQSTAEISIVYSSYICDTNVYFSTEENAQKAIDILGEETIRTALSTDW